MRLSIAVLAAVFLIGCRGASSPAPNANETAAPASVSGAAASSGTVTLPTGYPERPFVRVEFEKLTWRPTEGNTLGVETAVVEGWLLPDDQPLPRRRHEPPALSP